MAAGWQARLPLFEPPRVLMRLDDVATCIVNANYRIMGTAAMVELIRLHPARKVMPHVEFGVPYNTSMVDRNISRRRNIRHLAKKSRILRAVKSAQCRLAQNAQFLCPNLSENLGLLFSSASGAGKPSQ